ncbi:MAG: OmpA family protein [Paracoccaceae bacterium]|nr:OmpA family protein [Paracoccaceae bacterium]MDP7185337.1 OmpA family protein [Paracoccaceae bacterium]
MRRLFTSSMLSFAGAILLALAPVSSTAEPDWLDASAGAVVLGVTSQYDSGNSSAIATISGNSRFTWYTQQYDVGPQSITYELAQTVALQEFVMDTSSEYNTRAPKDVVLWGSSTSSEGPWSELARFQMTPENGRNVIAIPQDKAPAKWLKLDLSGNWGDAKYIAITEVEAYGEAVSETVYEADLSGNFSTNFRDMRLSMSGADVVGCYDWQQGTLSGDTDGRIFRFQWTEVPEQIGTSVMAISGDGNRFNGFFYENGEMQGIWWGQRNLEGEPECQLDTNNVEDALSGTSRAVLYGIHFDFDSDRLKSSALPTLMLLREALADNSDWTIEIEGHTDSAGSDAYNLELSNRRAASVRQWLIDNGISGDRLSAKGFGESRPVSGNETATGRSLNRRVEVVRR